MKYIGMPMGMWVLFRGSFKAHFWHVRMENMLMYHKPVIYEDLSAPWDMVMGYLPYMMQGMDMSIKHSEIENAAKTAGFSSAETHTELLCSGTQDIIILRK